MKRTSYGTFGTCRPVGRFVPVNVRPAVLGLVLVAVCFALLGRFVYAQQGANAAPSALPTTITQKAVAALHRAETDYAGAESLWKEATEMGAKQGGSSDAAANALYDAAESALNAGYLLPADGLLRAALPLTPAGSELAGRIENDLGEICFRQENIPEARKHHFAALRILEAVGPEGDDLCRTLPFIAEYQARAKGFEAGYPYVKRYATIHRERFSLTRDNTADMTLRAWYLLRYGGLPGSERIEEGIALLIRSYHLQQEENKDGSDSWARLLTLYLYGYMAPKEDPDNVRCHEEAEKIWQSWVTDRTKQRECLAFLDYVFDAADRSNRFDEILPYLNTALAAWSKQAPHSYGNAAVLHWLAYISLLRNDDAGMRLYTRNLPQLLAEVGPVSRARAETLLIAAYTTLEDAGVTSSNILKVVTGDRPLTTSPEETKEITSEVMKENLSPEETTKKIKKTVDERTQEKMKRIVQEVRQATNIAEILVPDSEILGNGYGLLAAMLFLEDRQKTLEETEKYLLKGRDLVERNAPLDRTLAYFDFGRSVIARQRNQIALANELQMQAVMRLATTRTAIDNFGKIFIRSTFNALSDANGDKAWQIDEDKRAWHLIKDQYYASSTDEQRRKLSEQYGTVIARLVEAQAAQQQDADAFDSLEDGRAFGLRLLLAEKQLDRRMIPETLFQKYEAAITRLAENESRLNAANAQKSAAHQAVKAAPSQKPGPANLKQRDMQDEQAVQRAEVIDDDCMRARSQVQNAWLEIQRTVPRLYPQAVSAEKGAESLPAGTLYIAFSVGETSTRLFLLHGKNDPAFASDTDVFRNGSVLASGVLPVTAKRLMELVNGIRDDIRKQSDTNTDWSPDDFRVKVNQLYRFLFPQKYAHILQHARRLIIAPDGVLWNLPFAVLASDPTEDSYLGLEKPLTYASSLTLYARSVQDAEARRSAAGTGRGKAFVVGDPLEGAAALGGAHDEAVRIARMYGVAPVLGPGATKQAVYQGMSGARMLHIATHGTFDAHNPMSSSGLKLASGPGAKTGSDFLSAQEILEKCRLQADLCVLSACSTGDSRIVNNEGAIGLIRALQYAGAASIVAAKWPVNDRATAELMVQLHTGLRNGMNKDEALCRAMREVHKAKAAPYFWAPFFLLGDPGKITL